MSYKQLIEVEIKWAENEISYHKWQEQIAKAGGTAMLMRMYKSFGCTYKTHHEQTSIPNEFMSNAFMFNRDLFLTFLLLLKEYCK